MQQIVKSETRSCLGHVLFVFVSVSRFFFPLLSYLVYNWDLANDI